MAMRIAAPRKGRTSTGVPVYNVACRSPVCTPSVPTYVIVDLPLQPDQEPSRSKPPSDRWPSRW